MSSIKYHSSKDDAIKHLNKKGYANHVHTGESGDHGHGSRLYYRKVGAHMKKDGQPESLDATVSKVGSKWATSDFNQKGLRDSVKEHQQPHWKQD